MTDKKDDILHAYVATPAYNGQVDCDYSQSLAESCQAATVYGIRVTAAVMGNGAFIDLARCSFARIFLEETDCTHLFFIDSDLKFEPRAFVSLIQAGKPVVAGAYRRRQENEDYPIRHMENPELGGLWLKDDWLQCDRVATGFLCIERSVVEQMAEKALKMQIHGQPLTPQLFYTKIDEENRFVGEDFCWCDDYMEQFNRPIEVWTDFDFVHGGYQCNYNKWLAKEVEAYKKSQEKPRRLGNRSAA